MNGEKTRYDTGKDKWAHGDPVPWGPSGNVFLGPCPACGTRTFTYGGGWRCLGPHCPNDANNPAPDVGPVPEWWWTVRVFLDGNAWCATWPGFVDLQESAAGFGRTPREAVDALRAPTPGGEGGK